eukprot:4034379-Amphidinium_carterae.1
MLLQLIGDNQPMKGVLSLRRRPRRLEPTKLEPTPTQKERAGMGTLKHAGFSKARQEGVHLSCQAKLGAPVQALLLSVLRTLQGEKSANPFGMQKARRTMVQGRRASYIQAARSGIPIGTPDWALPPTVGRPDSLNCKKSCT